MNILANNFAPTPYRQERTSSNANGHNLYFNGIPPQARILLLTIRNPANGSSKTLVIPQVEGDQGADGLAYEVRANVINSTPPQHLNVQFRGRVRFSRSGGSGTAPPGAVNTPWIGLQHLNQFISTQVTFSGEVSLNGGTTGVSVVTRNPATMTNGIHSIRTTTFTQSSTNLVGADRRVTGIFDFDRMTPEGLGYMVRAQQNWNNANRLNSNTGTVHFELEVNNTRTTTHSDFFHRLIARIQHITYNRQNGTLQFHRDRVRRQTSWTTGGSWGDTTNLQYILEVPY